MEDSNCVGLMVTNEPLLTRICVENVANMTFEIDTATSHSILSQDMYNRLQNDLAIRGRKPLISQPQQVCIKLADGSTMSRHLGMVQMYIAKNNRLSRAYVSDILYFGWAK